MTTTKRALFIIVTYLTAVFVAAGFAVFFENKAFAEPRHEPRVVFVCFPDEGDPYFVEFPQTVVVLHQKKDTAPWKDPDADDGTDKVGGVVYMDMDGKQHIAYINKRDRCLKLGYKTEV